VKDENFTPNLKGMSRFLTALEHLLHITQIYIREKIPLRSHKAKFSVNTYIWAMHVKYNMKEFIMTESESIDIKVRSSGPRLETNR
jgi:hypothetical protein